MPIFSGIEIEAGIIVFQINSRFLARAPHFFGLLLVHRQETTKRAMVFFGPEVDGTHQLHQHLPLVPPR
jgi:hypothetical protein